MRKLIYTIGAAACISLAACTGSSEYDAYVESLKAQTAAVDTISSAQSYAAFLENLATEAAEFAGKDIKLNEKQTEEITRLSAELQKAITAKYQKLAQTPMPLPSHFPVVDTDTATVK